MRPLSIAEIAAHIYHSNLPRGAMVHAYFLSRWAKATFDLGGHSYSWEIDALALRTADRWKREARVAVDYPSKSRKNWGRSLFAPSGTMVAMRVDKSSGRVSVDDVHVRLNAGAVIQRQLVEGQAEGSVAMGVGYALSEHLPTDMSGPGNGAWNLGQYQLPLANDVPLRRMTIDILEPTVEGEPARGIGETVICTAAPAIANAIADATGKRFRSLPILPEHIQNALS